MFDKKGNSAALYVRVSTKYQAEKGESLEAQKNRLIEWCKYNGVTDYEIFEDAGISSKNDAKIARPAYTQMLNQIKAGKFDLLVVTKLDRINRNVVDFNNMYNVLKAYNVKFVSISNGFDTSTPIGKAMVQICIVFAQMEIEQLSERVLETHVNVASTSGKLQGRPPYGYIRGKNGTPDAGKALVVETEAKVVKDIYKMYLSGKSTKAIAAFLNKNKIFGRKGGMWTSKGIGDILHNQFYIGTYIYNRCYSGTRREKPKEEWVIFENHHTPLISVQDFDRVQKMMSEKTTRDTRKPKTNIHLFKGLITCGLCGDPFICRVDNNPYREYPPSGYYCRNKYLRDESCVNEAISDVSLIPFIFRLVSNILQMSSSPSKIRSESELQRFLLKGNELSEVQEIDKDSLRKFWILLCSRKKITKKQLTEYETNGDEGINLYTEKEYLDEQKRNLEKALERLKNLYSMGDESYTAEEYLNDRHEIEVKLADITAKISESESETEYDSIQFDIFKTELSGMFLYEKLLNNSDEITYGIVDDIHNKKLLREFITSLIKNIVVKHERIISLEFMNGIQIHFQYQQLCATICKACGKRIGKTSCKKRTLMDKEDNWYQRIRIGNKDDAYTKYTKNKRCSSCFSKKGSPHHYGCPDETCPICGERVSVCGHLMADDYQIDSRRKHQKIYYLNKNYCILCKKTIPSSRCEKLQFTTSDGLMNFSRIGISPENTPLENNVCPGCGVRYIENSNRKFTHHFGCSYEVCPICFKLISECGHFSKENLKL